MFEKRNNLPLITLLLWIRDARSTSKAARALLYALALRCRPEAGFVCWPSYATLAKDTQLDEITLKRAAKQLEDAKIIKRITRRNRSNKFFIDASLLQKQAEAVKAQDKKTQELNEENDCPFNPLVFGDSDASHEEGGVE